MDDKIQAAAEKNDTVRYGGVKPKDYSTGKPKDYNKGMDNVTAVEKAIENDPAFDKKVTVNTQEELDALMSSPDADRIIVCSMRKREDDYRHIVLHKRVTEYNGRKVGTYVGATGYRNDIPYDYALQKNTLTFYLVNENALHKVQSQIKNTVKKVANTIQKVVSKVTNAVQSNQTSNKNIIKKTQNTVRNNTIRQMQV